MAIAKQSQIENKSLHRSELASSVRDVTGFSKMELDYVPSSMRNNTIRADHCHLDWFSPLFPHKDLFIFGCHHTAKATEDTNWLNSLLQSQGISKPIERKANKNGRGLSSTMAINGVVCVCICGWILCRELVRIHSTGMLLVCVLHGLGAWRVCVSVCVCLCVGCPLCTD